MTKHHSLLTAGGTLLALVLLLAPGAAHADPGSPPQQSANALAESRGNVSGFAGYVSGIGEGLESGPTFGGSGEFFFSRNLGVEASFQRQSVDASATTENRLSGGTLESSTILFGVVVRFPVGQRVAPYVVGGVAYFSNSFDVDPSVADELDDFNFVAIESVENVLGFQAGGGVDIALGRRVAVFGEARYVTGTADTAAELMDTVSGASAQVSGEQDLGRFQALAGVRILF